MEELEGPLAEFLDALPNEATRDHYKRFLRYFFEFLKLNGDLKTQSDSFTKRALKDESWTKECVKKFIRLQKMRIEKGEMSPASISNYYKPIKLFFDMNEIPLNWKKITRTIPKTKRRSTDGKPSKEEIIQILKNSDRRLKTAVLVMLSSGIRVGAWGNLRYGDILPITKNDKVVAAKVIVYRGEQEEYFTFITPEAYQALKEYIEFRKSHREIINEKSWVLRDEFEASNHGKGLATVPKQLKSVGLTRLIERALWTEGIRKPLEKGQKRHPFKVNHGFRKYFKTMAEQKMKSLHVEMLMGHATGLADNYYRISEEDLLEDYLKAIPDLSIFESTPQEDRIQKLEKGFRNMQWELADLIRDLGKEGSEKVFADHPNLAKDIKFTETDAMLVKDAVDGNEYLQ